MIIHFAAFILTRKDEESQKKAREEIVEALRKVEVDGQLGPMQFDTPLYPERAKGYDFALITRFRDRAALEEYAKDSEHEKAKKVISRHANLADTLDYDLDIRDDAW